MIFFVFESLYFFNEVAGLVEFVHVNSFFRGKNHDVTFVVKSFLNGREGSVDFFDLGS
jgi:hypothetical protein